MPKCTCGGGGHGLTLRMWHQRRLVALVPFCFRLLCLSSSFQALHMSSKLPVPISMQSSRICHRCNYVSEGASKLVALGMQSDSASLRDCERQWAAGKLNIHTHPSLCIARFASLHKHIACCAHRAACVLHIVQHTFYRRISDLAWHTRSKDVVQRPPPSMPVECTQE